MTGYAGLTFVELCPGGPFVPDPVKLLYVMHELPA
jgi:hypothetical protein